MDTLAFPLDCESIKGHSRTIIHIDIDCFYAQVEMLRNPELCDKPLGIQQKNIVVTCNYVAREFGVRKLMFISDAMKCCPNLVLVSGEDLTNYRTMSTKVTDLLQSRFSPNVERLGFDENFVDVSQLVDSMTLPSDNQVCGHVYGNNIDQCECGCSRRLIIGSHIAATMRQNIYDELGLTTCAGISYNKLLAKLVGEKYKPNQQTTLFQNQALDLINELPSIRSIPGIGRQSAEILKNKLNIISIESLQRCSLEQLTKALGSKDSASIMQKLGLGIDDSDVKSSGKPQSIGLEDAFKEACTRKEVEERLTALLKHLLQLLANQSDSRIPGTIRVTVRKYHKVSRESQRESRQCSLPSLPPGQQIVQCSDKVMPTVMELFNKMIAPAEKFHLTLLGIAFTNFTEPKTGKASILTFLEPASKKIKLECDEASSIQCTSSNEASTSSSSKSDYIPPHVDPEVFSHLPETLQQEIIEDWRQHEKEVAQQQNIKKKPKISITNYFFTKK